MNLHLIKQNKADKDSEKKKDSAITITRVIEESDKIMEKWLDEGNTNRHLKTIQPKENTQNA